MSCTKVRSIGSRLYYELPVYCHDSYYLFAHSFPDQLTGEVMNCMDTLKGNTEGRYIHEMSPGPHVLW